MRRALRCCCRCAGRRWPRRLRRFPFRIRRRGVGIQGSSRQTARFFVVIASFDSCHAAPSCQRFGRSCLSSPHFLTRAVLRKLQQHGRPRHSHVGNASHCARSSYTSPPSQMRRQTTDDERTSPTTSSSTVSAIAAADCHPIGGRALVNYTAHKNNLTANDCNQPVITRLEQVCTL